MRNGRLVRTTSTGTGYGVLDRCWADDDTDPGQCSRERWMWIPDLWTYGSVLPDDDYWRSAYQSFSSNTQTW